MIHEENTNVERIIAKIDNDFNPDNSDWIPRVCAWVIDAINIIGVIDTEKKIKQIKVTDRIVYLNCPINSNIKVYDENGCIIKEAKAGDIKCNCSSTGEYASETSDSNIYETSDTINRIVSKNNNPNLIAETINTKSWPGRYNVKDINYDDSLEKNYVIVCNNKIELNYDASYIIIVYDSIKTKCSEQFGCEIPIIPNNGILIEAITYYCMYKMLCRGYKHPIFNLSASQYGTNPYYMWNQLKDEAKRSIINNKFDNTDESKLFRSNFYIETFDPRN